MNEPQMTDIPSLAQALTEMLREAAVTVVIAHARPDGDTVGSAAALVRALNEQGHAADWICADPIPNRLRLLDEREDRSMESVFPALCRRTQNEDGTSSLCLTEEADRAVIISLDTAEYKLMGDDYAALFEGRVDIKLDHHPVGTPFGRYCHIDGDTGSCGELTYRLLCEMGAVSPETATALFAAISSDTGSFKYTNATAETHRIAAALMDLGADTERVTSKFYGQRSQKDIRALGLAFGSIRFFLGGRVAMLSVTNAQKEELGLCDEDLGEFASIPRDILGVLVGVTVKQADDKPTNYKISMRSNGTDVCAICQKLGGGGHVRASGAMVEASSMEEAEGIILAVIAESLASAAAEAAV